MTGIFYTPPAMLEAKGPDWFEPARPAPLQGKPSSWTRAQAGRNSLISMWRDSEYKSHCGAMRILGRQVVLANSPETVKHVMVARHDNYERKSPQMRRALEYLLGDGLFISDGDTWARRRPLVADIVHKNRLPTFGPTMESATADMVARWRAHPADQPLNALTEMAELTAEIISRTVFGNKLGPAAARKVIDGFTNYQGLVDNFNVGYFLGFDEGLPIFRGPRMRRAVAQVSHVIENVITDHLEGRGEGDSMIELLLQRQRKSPGAKLDISALRNEAATIFMAGHETTAATLTWTWYLLANAPWIEEAVLAEIERVCGARAPTIEDVGRLDWCRAVIEETLRLYPPVPILARQAREADTIGSLAVDKAALVLVVPWLLHRSPDFWDKPDRFLPERFLRAERPKAYTYIPFAVGPRICAGLSFGLSEAILCFATLVQNFRIRICPGVKVEPTCRLTLRPAAPLLITASPRPGGLK